MRCDLPADGQLSPTYHAFAYTILKLKNQKDRDVGASSGLDQVSTGLTGYGWNQFPPKTRLHHIWHVCKYRRVYLCCLGNGVWGRVVIALPSSSAAVSQVSQGGCGGCLCPVITEHLTNRDTAVTPDSKKCTANPLCFSLRALRTDARQS